MLTLSGIVTEELNDVLLVLRAQCHMFTMISLLAVTKSASVQQLQRLAATAENVIYSSSFVE